MKPTYEEVIEAMARGIMEDIIAPWKHLDNDEKKTGKDIAKLALRALQDMMPDVTYHKTINEHGERIYRLGRDDTGAELHNHFKTMGRDNETK